MLCFSKLGRTETYGLQSPRLYLTFNKAERSHVATADYSDAAGDRGGREVRVTAQTNGGPGSNKAGLLAHLPPADPVCLCEFMATV